MFFKTSYLLLLLSVLAACTREKIVLEDFGEESVAVNAIIDRTGNLLQVKLVKAQKVIGGGSNSVEPISNATVAIIHGTDSLFFFYDPFMYTYQTMGDTVFFRDNEDYRLYVFVPGTGELSAQVKLIERYDPVIDSARITVVPGNDVNSFEAIVYVQDQPAKENYYRIIPLGEWVNDADTADKIYFPFNSSSIYLYQDKIAVNNSMAFNLQIPGMSFPGYTLKRMRFVTFNIEKYYYSYYAKLSENSSSDQLNNPVFLPGNIQGGLGIFSSLNGQYEKSFNLP